MRGLGRIIADYASDRSADKPLCIAVFGSPGSGKSFAIKELAGELLSDDVETVKFNLSQASHHDELIPVYHQIRDAVVRARVPLFFWDEFDARYGDIDLGWLSQFLVPMEDGEFREHGFMHPLDRAIFIFAGATSHSMADFRARVFPEDDRAAEAIRAIKARDFYSRLHGYVDVLGPNPQGEDDRYLPSAQGSTAAVPVAFQGACHRGWQGSRGRGRFAQGLPRRRGVAPWSTFHVLHN